jgi:hypothetical protein
MAASGAQFGGNIWENPQVFQVNKRMPHVPLKGHATPEAALEAVQSIGRTLDKSIQISHYQHILNGFWDFKLFDSPADVPSGFWLPEAHLQEWSQVRARHRVPQLNVYDRSSCMNVLECAGNHVG